MKNSIVNLFKSKGIIGPSGKRKSCWKRYWDEECEYIFNKFSLNYRTKEEAWFCILHNIEPKICEICGDLAKFTGQIRKKNNYIGYNTVCDSCSANAVESKKNTISKTKKNYSQEKLREIINKRKNTNLEKYGDACYMCYGSDSFKNNLKEKYGDEHYNNHKQAIQTNLKKYGVKFNFQIPGFVEESILKKRYKYGNASNYYKTRQTNLKKYGKKHISQVKEFQIKSNNAKNNRIKKIEKQYNCTHIQKLLKKYGQGWKILGLEKIKIDSYVFINNDDIGFIKKYHEEGTHTNKYTSDKEKDLLFYIKSIYDGILIENDTSVVSNGRNRFFELDIYLPELKIAFDFNGTYWHSSKFKDPYYHQRKTIKCYEQGVQLIHIYEYDWDIKQDEIKNNIKILLSNPKSYTNYNWIPLDEYHNYNLTEPNKIMIDKNSKITNNINECKYILYDEGGFIKNEK